METLGPHGGVAATGLERLAGAAPPAAPAPPVLGSAGRPTPWSAAEDEALRRVRLAPYRIAWPLP